MTLFIKKKKETSTILPLLYDAYKRAREDGKNYFQYSLRDCDKTYAEDFCKKNHIMMTIDGIYNGNIIYKFIF